MSYVEKIISDVIKTTSDLLYVFANHRITIRCNKFFRMKIFPKSTYCMIRMPFVISRKIDLPIFEHHRSQCRAVLHLHGIAQRFGNTCNFPTMQQKPPLISVAFATTRSVKTNICCPILLCFIFCKTISNINKNYC